MLKKFLMVSMVTLLYGCMVGPDYVKPQLTLDERVEYKSAPAGWVWANSQQPSQASWWSTLDDGTLNALIKELHEKNPSIEEAYANYRAALASLGGNRADWLPSIQANAGATRSGSGAQSLTTGATSKSTREKFSAGLDFSWEIDLWGGIARQVEQGEANAEARAADWDSIRLSMEVELVKAYIQLRFLDQQIAYQKQMIIAQRALLTVVENKMKVGMVTTADVYSARSQLQTQEANHASQLRNRSELENSIAILVGKTPNTFAITPMIEKSPAVRLQLAIPSDVLLRRPDIYSAEQKVRAANAQIGVATASYFPSFVISANSGSNAEKIADLFTAPARAWSIGGSIIASLFDGGKRSAQVQSAEASFDASVANYKKVSLQAIMEVDNAIMAINTNMIEEQSLAFATESARLAYQNTKNAFNVGQADYPTLMQAELSYRQAQNSYVNGKMSLELEKINLIRAAGGGWTEPEAQAARDQK